MKSYQWNFDLGFLNSFTSFLLAARTEATRMFFTSNRENGLYDTSLVLERTRYRLDLKLEGQLDRARAAVGTSGPEWTGMVNVRLDVQNHSIPAERCQDFTNTIV